MNRCHICANVSCLISTSAFAAETSSPTSAFAVSSGNGCAKCVSTKKSGKYSCCARGGAWFNNCGDEGDAKYNHTWVEGNQACRNVAGSVSVKAQVMVNRQGVFAYPVNSTQSQNETEQQINLYPLNGTSVPDTGVTDAEDCVGLPISILYTCVIVLVTLLDF